MSNRTLVVKWHSFNKTYNNVFKKVILLIRNPYTNVFSFFNYIYGGEKHSGYAQAKHYKGEFNVKLNSLVFLSVSHYVALCP